MNDWHDSLDYLDVYGKPRRVRTHGKPLDQMMVPVECAHCGTIYDLTSVEVVARYLDCSVWTSPCCRRPGCDDRGGGPFGKSMPDIHRVGRDGRRRED